MAVVEFNKVFSVNNRLAVKLTTLAKLLKYSDVYLLRLVKRLLKRGIKIGFKWRKNWYIFLPTVPINKLIDRKKQKKNNNSDDIAVTPSGHGIDINSNWLQAVDQLPISVSEQIQKSNFNVVLIRDQLYVLTLSSESGSLGLSSKNLTQPVLLNQGSFPSIKEYRYGRYITYKDDKMSTFKNGGGTLRSDNLPAALFEVARELDAAEQDRNGANPGLTPRRNLTTTISFDTGTIAIAATLPVVFSAGAGGSQSVALQNYLGSTWTAFAPGTGGDLTSTNVVSAFLEVASLLATAEKAIQPDEPNNVQIQYDQETGTATVAANLPFTTEQGTNGDVTIIAIDYL
jgi:hypothetical protein